jgi:hypothetical protein
VSCFASGATVTTRTISGSNTNITTAYYDEVELDPAGKRIYVASNGGVIVFNNADTVQGNVAPNRVISFGAAQAIALDVTHDMLYAAVSGTIVRIPNASTANGNVSLAATLQSGSVYQLWVDEKHDRLYAAVGGVRVWDNASTLTGNVSASNRFVNVTGADGSLGGAIDTATDTLYVGSRNNNSVYAVANGSSANGTGAPARTLTSNTDLSYPMNAAIFGDTLVVSSDNGGAKLQEFDKASTLSGNVSATRKLGPTIPNIGGFAYVP